MRNFVFIACSALSFVACREEGNPKYAQDADGDGVRSDVDCDDADPSTGEPVSWYLDADGDGIGGPDGDTTCAPPADAAAETGDCDDADPEVAPGVAELCDGIDQDCDGVIDNGLEVVSAYEDADGDGYGDDGSVVSTCAPPAGTVEVGGDCDDGDPAWSPGADESDCTDPNDYNCDGLVAYADADTDGWAACVECDDNNPAVSPDGVELCNGLDDDCDGQIDEDVADSTTLYADLDGDGFGDPESPSEGCDATGVEDATDCDDTRPTTWPGADETCNDVDDDCDGELDEDALAAPAWYLDGDADGYGAGTASSSCDAPSGAVGLDGDCDDTNAAYNPGAAEADCDDPNDYNCDGSVGFADADADGWAACAECDDGDPAISPDATEVCNDRDDDCDGDVDGDAVDAGTWYADTDGDSFGDALLTMVACEAPDAHVGDSTDCDDGDGTISPAAEERCNGVDDNCDGDVDESGVDATAWYADADGDGFGDPSSSEPSCAAPAGYVADRSDCDDLDGAVSPAGTELCNSRDDDCDGTSDEDDAVDAAIWYTDLDGDSFGDPLSGAPACSAPAGSISDNTDCDDTAATVSPAGIELCNGIDDDCDTVVDEDDASDTRTWYADADADGYGDAAAPTLACAAPAGTVASSDDCDDTNGAISPGAAELCNGVDDDCDATIDEDSAADAAIWYADADGDSFGDAGVVLASCVQPESYVANPDDCVDSDAGISPAGVELCNLIDDNCDGTVDENSAADATTWYADADGDGFGDGGSPALACVVPAGYAVDASDCDDTNADVSPAGAEVCNLIDDDCDGLVDDADADVDTATGSSWYADGDGDGYGDAAVLLWACAQPSASATSAGDCDDADPGVSPSAAETCDGADDDCDGVVDDPADLLGSGEACGAVNCVDIMDTRVGAASGEYWVEFDGTAMPVYCDMDTAGGGWTVLHPDLFGSLGSLDAMRTEMDRAMVYLRSYTGARYYTEVEQLPAFISYDVDVADLDSSRTRITFVPRPDANVYGQTQGFVSNGTSLTFTNCDANGNSYIEFWRTGTSYTWNQDYNMSLRWRDTRLAATGTVPDEFFAYTAVHFGGCGTHSTSAYWVHYDNMRDTALAIR